VTASEDGAGVSMHGAWIQKKKEIVKREIKARGLVEGGRWTDLGKEEEHKAVRAFYPFSNDSCFGRAETEMETLVTGRCLLCPSA